MSSADFPLIEPPVQETWSEKGARKFKENPFVPIGFAASVAALAMGANKVRIGADPNELNWWMRARIGAHAFTVAACCIGIYVAAAKNPEKVEQLNARRDAERDFVRRMKNAEYTFNGEEMVSKGGRLRARAPTEDDGIPIQIQEVQKSAPKSFDTEVTTPKQVPAPPLPPPAAAKTTSWLSMLWGGSSNDSTRKP